MIGDGYKSRIACENYEGEDCAPDASPAYCDATLAVERKFFLNLVGALKQLESGDGLDAAFWHKLKRLTKKASETI